MQGVVITPIIKKKKEKGEEEKRKETEKGEGRGREGKGREGKGREGKGREGKGREGKGRERKDALFGDHNRSFLGRQPRATPTILMIIQGVGQSGAAGGAKSHTAQTDSMCRNRLVC